MNPLAWLTSIDWLGLGASLLVALLFGAWAMSIRRSHEAAVDRHNRRQEKAHRARELAEPEAAALYGPEATPEMILAASAAISLRRIANSLGYMEQRP